MKNILLSQLFSNQSRHPTWMPHLPHWFRRWGGW